MLTLPIPLSSLYEGIRSQTLYFNRTSICPHCRGTGVSTPEHVHVCPYCNGTGLREYCTVISREIGYSYSTVCSVCGGSGHLPNSEFSCSHCGGSGVKNTQRIKFDVDKNNRRLCGSQHEWRDSKRLRNFLSRRCTIQNKQ